MSILRRRVLLLGLTASLAPWAAWSQKDGRVVRVGILGNTPAGDWQTFRQVLRAAGWVEGRNVVYIERWLQGQGVRAVELAASLVKEKPDVILALTSTEVEALRQFTTTIPIVFAFHADPITLGHVQSLARPGRNITGVSILMTEAGVKMLEMLHDMLPQARRVGVLWNPTSPAHQPALKAISAGAARLNLQPVPAEARDSTELSRAFARLADAGVEAIVVVASPMTVQEAPAIAELCLRYRLPAMFGFRQNAEAGGLASYGVESNEHFARAATYVDRVLRGANPAELPVEQPTKLQLVINLKTAKALGLTVPARLLVRADRLIE